MSLKERYHYTITCENNRHKTFNTLFIKKQTAFIKFSLKIQTSIKLRFLTCFDQNLLKCLLYLYVLTFYLISLLSLIWLIIQSLSVIQNLQIAELALQ